MLFIIALILMSFSAKIMFLIKQNNSLNADIFCNQRMCLGLDQLDMMPLHKTASKSQIVNNI